MKAKDRCKDYCQGDRCKLEPGHGDSHVGNFVAWDRADAPMELYPREHRRNRLAAKQDQQQKSWIKNMTLMIRLGALAEIYLKPFMKEPEEK